MVQATLVRRMSLNFEGVDEYGFNAVHMAVDQGDLLMLRVWKDMNVDIHATTSNGANAVHIAVEKGHLAPLQSSPR